MFTAPPDLALGLSPAAKLRANSATCAAARQITNPARAGGKEVFCGFTEALSLLLRGAPAGTAVGGALEAKTAPEFSRRLSLTLRVGSRHLEVSQCGGWARGCVGIFESGKGPERTGGPQLLQRTRLPARAGGGEVSPRCSRFASLAFHKFHQ